MSSIGLYHVLGGTAQLLAMLMVQLSVSATVHQLEPALRAVWGGLDVAWDLYIGTGTILFALCMFGRRGLGVWLTVPGLLIGCLLIIFNIATFPKPPESAGLVDFGPLVGLWYLVVHVRLDVSSILLEIQQRKSSPQGTIPGGHAQRSDSWAGH